MPAIKLIGPLGLKPVTKRTPIGSILVYRFDWDTQNRINDKFLKRTYFKFIKANYTLGGRFTVCDLRVCDEHGNVTTNYISSRYRKILCVYKVPSLEDQINNIVL